MDKKLKQFRQMISDRNTRKALVNAGIKYSVVYSWGKTTRIPSEQNAKLISNILGIPLHEIPYYRQERVI